MAYPEVKPPFERILDKGDKEPNRIEMIERILLPEQVQISKMVNGFDDPRHVYMRSWVNPALID